MENKNRLYDYIAHAYPRWVEYASYHVRQSRLAIDPAEVVNDVLCMLLERDRPKLERMIKDRSRERTELDFYVMRIVKISIHSPRSPFRYQRGQHCTVRLDEGCRPLPVAAPEFDQEDAYTQVRQVFDTLQVSELSKRIFAWRVFEGKSFAEWPGPESQKLLYDTFNRILLIISAKIRRKNAS